jgi:hypothetical protein
MKITTRIEHLSEKQTDELATTLYSHGFRPDEDWQVLYRNAWSMCGIVVTSQNADTHREIIVLAQMFEADAKLAGKD